ncbi:MAG: amidohydrolase family protein [Deltaproteobacteria bacterium]|jgi:hypothetical protein|nr:amidohydrolase family protein [Deltaproteobacteria bacterium]
MEMKIRVKKCVFNSEQIEANVTITLKSHLLKSDVADVPCGDKMAYPPLINSHEHLISNWTPRFGDRRPYSNCAIWVEELKHSQQFIERSKVWQNDGTYALKGTNVELLISLGIYKNIFSGCISVQDHMPNQQDDYYEKRPIHIIKDYRQCHSVALGNWWGGRSAVEEWRESEGRMPFIMHLAEGTDQKAKAAFSVFKNLELLQDNSIIVHGIALSESEIKECAKKGTTLCWCPASAMFLVGEMANIDKCLEYGVNIILGTDSTLSGSTNILEELKFIHKILPNMPNAEIYRMITENAQKALFLPESYGRLRDPTPNLLILPLKHNDPFENLLLMNSEDIELLVHEGVPLYGNRNYLENFSIEESAYFFFKIGDCDKFVIGHPEQIVATIGNLLGYHKEFPYLPFEW